MWKNLKQQDFKQNKFVFLSTKETCLLICKSVAAVVLINFCFYRQAAVFLFLWPIGIVFYQREKQELLQKKKEEGRQQFKEMLLLTVAGQRAGYSVENAFLNGYEDLLNLYGKDSGICIMLREVKAGLANHISIGDLWKSIGEVCEIVEIREFAQVFMIAKESGGNMAAILENAAETIADKAETQKEIAVIMSAGRMEQKIMNVMPFALMLYMNMTSPGYFDGFYGNLTGVVIMTGCLLFYLTAYLLGEKAAKIEI